MYSIVFIVYPVYTLFAVIDYPYNVIAEFIPTNIVIHLVIHMFFPDKNKYNEIK